MQKRPSIQYVPKALSSKFPFMAGLGNYGLHPYNPQADYRFHDCTEFVCCHSGRGVLLSEEKAFPFQAGDVLFISPYMPHYLYKEGEERCRCEFIHVNLTQMHDPEIFGDIIEFTEQLLVPFTLNPVISGEKYPVFRELILLMLDEIACAKPYFMLSIKGYCMSIVAQLKMMWDQREEEEGTEHRSSLYPALVYMNRYYYKDTSIPELAAICHLSETHFRRLFKSKFAMSPLDYLNHIRIRESCIRLSRRSLLISQAAEQAGFRTLSSYNRKFLEIMGMSPSQWIKTHLESAEKPSVIYYT